jgi:hypothetical protein
MYKYVHGETYTAEKIAQPIAGTGFVDVVGSDGITPIAFTAIALFDDAVGTTELTIDTDFEVGSTDARYTALEGVDVYRSIRILNATYQSAVFYADFTAVGGYAGYAPEVIYPVGATYTQYATEDSATANTAMPASLSPASLFGGTWALMYDDEGIDFHTEGYDTVLHGRGQARQADGIARDEMQKITGDTEFSRLGYDADIINNGAFNSVSSPISGTGAEIDSGTTRVKIQFDSSLSPNAKTSDDTDGRTTDRNRWMRLWERTA